MTMKVTDNQTVEYKIAQTQAISPIATHFSVVWSVRLSSVTQCTQLNLHVIWHWQVHLCVPTTHCVRWGPWLQERGKFGCSTPSLNLHLPILIIYQLVAPIGESTSYRIINNKNIIFIIRTCSGNVATRLQQHTHIMSSFLLHWTYYTVFKKTVKIVFLITLLNFH